MFPSEVHPFPKPSAQFVPRRAAWEGMEAAEPCKSNLLGTALICEIQHSPKFQSVPVLSSSLLDSAGVNSFTKSGAQERPQCPGQVRKINRGAVDVSDLLEGREC